MDDEQPQQGQGQNEEEIEPGKIPVYPRGMLKFELGYGDGQVVKAIEYKRLGGLILGETELGAKFRVRSVRVLRGVRKCFSLDHRYALDKLWSGCVSIKSAPIPSLPQGR
jgi:hypothetical protein